MSSPSGSGSSSSGGVVYPPSVARMHMIQASFGDNLLLEFNDSDTGPKHWWLVDGGPGAFKRAGSSQLTVFSLFQILNGMKIAQLDKIVVTHNDLDHVNGIMILLQSIANATSPNAKAFFKKYRDFAFQGASQATTNADFYTWVLGYQAVNPASGSASFPVSDIWFNDIGLVDTALNHTARTGWMTKILAFFQEVYSLKTPILNREWSQDAKSSTVVAAPTDPKYTPPGIKLFGPTPTELIKLASQSSDHWVKWKIDAKAFKKLMTGLANYPGSIYDWISVNAGKLSPDDAAKNLSSIMFEFTDAAKRTILFTGDSTGNILDAQITENFPKHPMQWTILKIMHHGSSRNSQLTGVRDGMNMLEATQEFFKKYKAKKYCISADTFGKNPNPDSNTVVSIVGTSAGATPLLYITNGISFEIFKRATDTTQPFFLFVLKRGATVSGTVTNVDIATQEEANGGWLWINTDTNNFAYFLGPLQFYFDVFKAKNRTELLKRVADETVTAATSRSVKRRKTTQDDTPIFAAPHRYETRSSIKATVKQGKRKATALAFTLAPSSEKLAIATAPTVTAPTATAPTATAPTATPTPLAVPRALRSLVATPSPLTVGAAASAPGGVGSSQAWHNLLTSGLSPTDLEDLTDFDDDPGPPNAVTLVVEDGNTQQWVDLATFISYLEKDVQPTSPGLPAVGPTIPVIPNLKTLYGSGASTADGPPVVLASMLLQALIGTDDTIEMFNSLPLNTNGAHSLAKDLNAKTTPASMLNMTVQNFRALIIVPTLVQYNAGTRLLVPAYYFELAPPLPELDKILATEFMTWTAPFESGSWQHGQLTFQHQGSLRVKMAWPQYTNRVNVIHFDSVLTVTRSATPASLPCRGLMVALAGRPATYDIQFKGDADGNVELLSIYQLFAPLQADFFKIFGNLLSQFDVPGLDIPSIITKDLKLENAGIILHQNQLQFASVSIEDFYGTLSLSQAVQLAGDVLHLPQALSLPTNLPSITVTLGNIISPGSNTISFSFSNEVSDLGLIGFEISQADNLQTRVDVWAICNDDVTLADVLAKLDFGYLTTQFDAARVFSDALSHVSVPYIHMAFGRQNAHLPGSSYGPLEFEVLVQIDDINIPAENPVLTISDFMLSLRHGSPSDTDSTDIIVRGTSTVRIADYDAICTFSIDPGANADAAFVGESSQGQVDEDPNIGIAPTIGDTGGYSGDITFEVSFPNETPSLGNVLSHFAGSLADAAGLSDVRLVIPDALSIFLDCVDFRDLEFTLSKNTSTSNKWLLSQFYAALDLDTLQDSLNLFGVAITFELPTLQILVNNPTSSSRSYVISLTSPMIIQSVLCDVTAQFTSLPAGVTPDANSYIKITIATQADAAGLPVGQVVQHFLQTGVDQLGISFQQYIPSQLDATALISSIDVNNIVIGFANVSTDSGKHNFQLQTVEATVLSTADPWTPFENFSISEAQLHFAHDTGIAPSSSTVVTATTEISFNCILTIKSSILQAAFTHDSLAGSWSLSLDDTGAPLDIVQFVLDCIDDIGLSIDPSLRASISDILKIDLTSFYISYAPAHKNPTSGDDLPLTITFAQNGTVTLFGIGVSSIQVICEKSSSGWNYTVALALPSPCFPLDSFVNSVSSAIPGLSGPIPGLSGIEIDNGHFSFSKGQVSTTISKAPTPAKATSTSVCLSGKLLLSGSDFFTLIHDIIKIDEVDINILPGLVEISIPPGSGGLSILNIFTVLSFDLQITVDGFGLGASIELDCDWLSKDKILTSFFLLVNKDGGFGASIDITTDIVEPFHLPGVVLTKAGFSVVWLSEAEEPQSLAAHAGLKISAAGAEDIEASFAMSIDELNPSANFFKMNIEHLTVVNVIKAMTQGHLPSPLDSGVLDYGFKQLDINLNPSNLDFDFNADFYFFALEGKVAASAHVTTGISFAANLNPVDILSLVQIHAYDNTSIGPFIFLDTTVQDILSNNTGPPPWLGVTSKDDPRLKGAVFALSSKMVFFGSTLGLYGVINVNDGLVLVIDESEPLPSVPGTTFKFSETITISINAEHFKASTMYKFSFGLNLPKIEILGVSLGSFDGELVELDGDFELTVTYSVSSWEKDGAEFFVMVHVDILGLQISEQADLDITVGSLGDIPGQIESFVEHKVIDYLETKIAAPFEQAFDEAKTIANEAAAVLSNAFNAAEEDVVHGLLEAGHDVEAIADALKNELSMGVDEVAGALIGFGHDVTQVADALGSVFDAAPQEIASTLISAGVTIEHAFEFAFGEVGGELSKDFNLVGNSIAAFGADVVDTIGNFVTGDLENFVDDAVTDLGDFLSGVGNAFVAVFDSCEIM